MRKIVFVSHCLLNPASKVVMFNKDEMEAEETLRMQFLKKALENNVDIIQLPCPEFTLYGANRWGHVSNQFDNIFFRTHCRKILFPVIEQLKEYLAHKDRFEILGFVGIDGSPSCGVDYTCVADWFGSFESRPDLQEVLSQCTLAKKTGIFMSVLMEMLQEEHLLKQIKITSLFAPEPEKCLHLLDSVPNTSCKSDKRQLEK